MAPKSEMKRLFSNDDSLRAPLNASVVGVINLDAD
jgi:hypothetical protein